MNNITKAFDDFYDSLPTNSREELINHILQKRLQISLEGFDSGRLVNISEGVSAGRLVSVKNKKVCPTCGKP